MSSIGSSTSAAWIRCLLSYYQAQLNDTPSAVAAANAVSTATSASSSNSATANDNPPWNKPHHATAMRETAKILSTTNFLNTTECAADGRRHQRHQDRAGQSETFLALQRGQVAVLSGAAGAKLHRDLRPAGRPQHALPDRACPRCRIISPPPASTITPCRRRRRLPASPPPPTVPLRQLHLQHPATGHQRQYQQSGAGPFRLRQLHHRGEQGRHHHQCADRSLPGAGPADAGQYRQLYQFAAFRRRLLHPLPEDRDRAAPPPPTPPPPMACRSRPAPTRTISLSAASTPALYLVGNSGQRHRSGHHHRHRHQRPGHHHRPPTRAAASPRSAISAARPPRRQRQPGRLHRHHHGAGDGGGFQRQCLCAGQRHRQFRQPDQSGHAGRLSHQI